MNVIDRNSGPDPYVVAAAALWFLFMGVNEITGRLLIEVEGVVVSSRTTAGNRPVTAYVLRGSDGEERGYTAGPTDKSLPRRLPVGTYLGKNKYELSYVENGKVVNDFPLGFYVGICCVGIMLAWWGISQWRFRRALEGFSPKVRRLTKR